MHVLGMLRHYNPLADKIMCDLCRQAHLLSTFYFTDYEDYITKAVVKHILAESADDYVKPAKQSTSQTMRITSQRL